MDLEAETANKAEGSEEMFATTVREQARRGPEVGHAMFRTASKNEDAEGGRNDRFTFTRKRCNNLGTPGQIIFFQRQLGQTTAFGGVTKTLAETNIQQPGQLANPLEFSLFGFLFEVMPGTTLADFNAVYTTSVFTFLYTKRSWCRAA